MKDIRELKEIAAQYDVHAMGRTMVVVDHDADEVVVKMTAQLFQEIQVWLDNQRIIGSADADTERAVAREEEQVARDYEQKQRATLAPEIEAYKKMLPELLKTHKGKWVALHGGEIVDSDNEFGALAERVNVKFPDHIFIELVQEEFPRRFEIPSVLEFYHVSV